MRYIVLHESEGRIRIRIPRYRMSMREADLLEYYIRSKPFVAKVKVYDCTGDAVIRFAGRGRSSEKQLLKEAMESFSYQSREAAALVPEHSGRELDRKFQEQLAGKILWRVFKRLLFPANVQNVLTIIRSTKFIYQGLSCLAKGRIEVPVLDATAITTSMLRSDFGTASSVMFLLEIGEMLEEWTHRKSVNDLADAMSLKIDRVWKREDDTDVLTDIRKIHPGDHIVVRTSNVIPLDGKVINGEASVNQAAMTGESVPVLKQPGGYVYAGTVVEDGNCVIEVSKAVGGGKYDRIVQTIEESEKLKSATEERAFHLADRLVPFSLIGAALTWLITRNVNKAVSFLMVDFSCALKLSMPLSVLSAIREASQFDISVKGGKFMEAIAVADTIIFDKTGTLTHATPTVVKVTAFDGMSEREALRLAACLEEHYPHSVANAVVKEAKNRGIRHDEMHSNVQYVVAHGIASEVDGKKALIGSAHFVFEDEHTVIAPEEEERVKDLPGEYSHLYLALDGRLKAAISVFDPLREEAAQVVNELYDLGFKRVCMMTGDNERTASAVAGNLNLSEYRAEALPEDKVAFIKEEHAAGRKVVMVGDGINDAPALSEADAGIAISDGAAIAREISDVTISSADLHQLVILRKLSLALMDRIHRNYRFILTFNGTLIGLGVLGVLTPSSSSLLHNVSTIVTGVRSMTDLLPEDTIRSEVISNETA